MLESELIAHVEKRLGDVKEELKNELSRVESLAQKSLSKSDDIVASLKGNLTISVLKKWGVFITGFSGILWLVITPLVKEQEDRFIEYLAPKIYQYNEKLKEV